MTREKANGDFCASQARRLEGLKWFKDGGLPDLARALLKFCRTQAHASATVTAWLEMSRDAPTPADIIDLARGIDIDAPTFPPCRACYDSGIDAARVQQIERYGNNYEMAVYCDCPRGRYHEAEGLARRRPSGIERAVKA